MLYRFSKTLYRFLNNSLQAKINSANTLFHLQRYAPSQSSAMMLDVTGTVIHANADPSVQIAYSDFMHMVVCSLHYDSFPKVRFFLKIAIYRHIY